MLGMDCDGVHASNPEAPRATSGSTSHRDPVALPTVYVNHHPLAVDVAHLQMRRLTEFCPYWAKFNCTCLFVMSLFLPKPM